MWAQIFGAATMNAFLPLTKGNLSNAAIISWQTSGLITGGLLYMYTTSIQVWKKWLCVMEGKQSILQIYLNPMTDYHAIHCTDCYGIKYSGPSLSGHSYQTTVYNVATNL